MRKSISNLRSRYQNSLRSQFTRSSALIATKKFRLKSLKPKVNWGSYLLGKYLMT